MFHPPVLFYIVEYDNNSHSEMSYLYKTTRNNLSLSILDETYIINISIAAVNIIGIGPYKYVNGMYDCNII